MKIKMFENIKQFVLAVLTQWGGGEKHGKYAEMILERSLINKIYIS